MPTLAAGNPEGTRAMRAAAGFTLLELLVVLAIVGFASAGVGFALRDGTQARLEREALRLSALFESARARSQMTGVSVRWLAQAKGFRFDGLPAVQASADNLPEDWLDDDTMARLDAQSAPDATSPALPPSLLLGPEPIIEPQAVTLYSRRQPELQLRLATDGVRPFGVQAYLP